MATQKDLAKLAGVSAGTVSNVISGSPSVAKEVRKKVLDAIKILNYQPNLIARSLKTNRTNTLGIIIPDITMSFYPLVVRGAEAAVREHVNFLIVLDSERDPAREMELLSLLRSQRVDGILLVAATGHRWSASQAAQVASGPPIICVDRLSNGLDTDSVCVDDHEAARIGVAHLLAMGHKKIAILTGPQSFKNEKDRLNGYLQAMREADVPVRESLLLRGSFDSEEVTRLCSPLLSRARSRSLATALFTTNGTAAIAALKALYAAGLRTPDDLAFATIDEITAEEFFEPRITSVVQPAFDMGYRAVEVLLDRISKDNSDTARVKVRLPAKLVIRDSSSRAFGRD